MISALYGFLKLDQYQMASVRNRAGLIYINAAIMLSFIIAYGIAVPAITDDGERLTIFAYALTRGIFTPVPLLFMGLGTFLFITGMLVRRGQIQVAAWALIAAWFLGGFAALAGLPSLGTAAVSLINVLLISTLLLQERGLLASYLVVVVSILVAVVVRGDQIANTGDTFTILTQISVISVVLYLFLRFFRLSLSEGVNEAVDERVKTNQIINEITKLVAERAQSSELSRKITRSVIEAFDYIYQARLYMLDDANVEAALIANSTGTNAGEMQTLERVSVGSLSTLGEAAGSGHPIVTRLTEDTGVDVVLPMKIGGRVIALLNLRTRRLDHFEQETILNTFAAMADSIALALDNVNQFERAEARVRENNQLVQRAQDALREVERLNQRLTGSAWTQFLRTSTTIPGVTINFEDGSQIEDDAWTKSLSETVQINHLVQDEAADHQVIAVPLRVRGQVIGAMEFELDKEHNFTPEDLELIQDVSERFGLAVENTRLVQESQRVAQREALMNQISARLQSANEVNTALTEAARGLRDALKASRVSITLGEPAEQPPAVNSGNGGKSS